VSAPPEDLNDWGKQALISELERLRAITREMAAPVVGGDPRENSGADVVDVAGDPYARGGALFDARNAVLLDAMEVMLVDDRRPTESVMMFMALKGRVNTTRDRVEHGYLYGADGAAALVTEILGMVKRSQHGGPDGIAFAADFKRELDRRLGELP
jgi:hypothetical protein